MTCEEKNPHAYTKITDYPKNNLNSANIKNVEYVDLENIPIKTMTHISFVLEQKVLNIYLNGKLRKIKKFLGTPVINKLPMMFNYQKSYDGVIYDFRYLPYEVSSKKVTSLYNNIPNVDKFTKSHRFSHYMKHYHFKKAVTSIF